MAKVWSQENITLYIYVITSNRSQSPITFFKKEIEVKKTCNSALTSSLLNSTHLNSDHIVVKHSEFPDYRSQNSLALVINEVNSHGQKYIIENIESLDELFIQLVALGTRVGKKTEIRVRFAQVKFRGPKVAKMPLKGKQLTIEIQFQI